MLARIRRWLSPYPNLEGIRRDLEASAIDHDGEKVVQWDEARTRGLLGLTHGRLRAERHADDPDKPAEQE